MDSTLATFQSNAKNEDIEKNELKYSVKVTDTDKIKNVDIHTGKPNEKGDIAADLYKSDTPSGEVMGYSIEGNIRSNDLKGSLEGKRTKDLVRKKEKREAYLDIRTEYKPKGKVRDTIKKLIMS